MLVWLLRAPTKFSKYTARPPLNSTETDKTLNRQNYKGGNLNEHSRNNC